MDGDRPRRMARVIFAAAANEHVGKHTCVSCAVSQQHLQVCKLLLIQEGNALFPVSSLFCWCNICNLLYFSDFLFVWCGFFLGGGGIFFVQI